jgi:hypothetical protein
MPVKGLVTFEAVPISANSLDSAPNGCSSCHVKTVESDLTLAAMASRVRMHPKTETDTFEGCMTCHNKGKYAFRASIHPSHLTNDQYVKAYGGSCLNCHAVTGSGSTAVKSR